MMTKFLIIVWFSIGFPNQLLNVGYVVNTTMEFDNQQDCTLYVGLEQMPLTIGIEDWLDREFPAYPHKIEQIGCIDTNTLKELNKTQNSR